MFRPTRKNLLLLLAAIFMVAIVTGCGASDTATGGVTPSAQSTATNVHPTPTHALAWTTIQSFSGNGAKKTAIFTVGGDWKIVYTCQGLGQGIDGLLTVTVYDQASSPVDIAAVNSTCKDGQTTKDFTEEHQGGSVYLDVNGTGDWTIDVQEPK